MTAGPRGRPGAGRPLAVTAAGLLVGLGLLARAVRYGLRFPLWEDECFLAANLLGPGLASLFEPLRYHQVAPPLFLLVEKGLVGLLGFSEPVLRLPAFVAGVVSLLLFRRLAGLLLDGAARLLAVALFAVSYPCVRYAAEGKPYGLDVLVSLALLVPVAAWWRSRARPRALGLAAALVPAALGLSFPAVFVAGGLVVFVAVVLARRGGSRAERLLLALLAATTAASFAGWQLVVAPQRAAEAAFMADGWQHAFPPASLLRLPLWLVEVHAGGLLAYPVGGEAWGSTGTLLLAVLGAGLLARRRQAELGLLLAAPFALQLGAAFLRRYPYGGHPRLALHLAPLVCLAAALGLRAALGPLARRGRRGLRPALAALALIGVATIGRDLAFPYKTASDERARAFARWFWPAADQREEVACAYTDLGVDLAPGTFRELSWSAQYLCNRRIYAPRPRAELSRVSAARPLRCLVYRDPRFPLDERAFAAWRRGMEERYEPAGREVFPFPRHDKRERRLLHVDWIESYLFRPRPAGGTPPRGDGP